MLGLVPILPCVDSCSSNLNPCLVSVQVFSIQHQSINIAVSLCLFGFFALPLIPASMELGVETTYPVDEATSSGLLWSSA